MENEALTATMNGTEVPVVAEVAHSGWIDKTVKATLRDPAAAVTIFDLNGNVSQSLEFDELAGNVKEGDKVGTITFKQRNTVIATMDLVACEDVDAPDFFGPDRRRRQSPDYRGPRRRAADEGVLEL